MPDFMGDCPYSADQIIEFWFSDEAKQKWFASTPAFDDALRRRFEPCWQAARDGRLLKWEQTIEGMLALIILLDQIPLNIYRGNAQAYSTEALARDIARRAIDNGYDRSLSDEQRVFLYMPFMHSEHLPDQDRAVALFENAGLRENLKFARHHRQIIHRFGRFPHRNQALGRVSTKEELAWLDSEEGFSG